MTAVDTLTTQNHLYSRVLYIQVHRGPPIHSYKYTNVVLASWGMMGYI